MDHKTWLDNEYCLWVAALASSTVHNFKDHPQVRRMLGDFEWPQEFQADLSVSDRQMITTIDDIGRSQKGSISGTCWRMVYYARQILERNPLSIIEIGGGVGQFYATLRALGFQGRYYIFDLEEVKEFQDHYLAEVEKQTGLSLPRFQYPKSYEFCVSFYALGEFDDKTKDWYVEHVVRRCPHGFVIWNPHSGASDVISFPCTIRSESPLMSPGNKQLEW